jgi:hypothetical protein
MTARMQRSLTPVLRVAWGRGGEGIRVVHRAACRRVAVRQPRKRDGRPPSAPRGQRYHCRCSLTSSLCLSHLLRWCPRGRLCHIVSPCLRDSPSRDHDANTPGHRPHSWQPQRHGFGGPFKKVKRSPTNPESELDKYYYLAEEVIDNDEDALEWVEASHWSASVMDGSRI